jgi:ribose 5-phosphate isomerase A
VASIGSIIIRSLSLTSYQSKWLCYEYKIPLVDLAMLHRLDIAIDGADEIDGDLNAIKGGGAAQTIEKIVATLANEFILIADDSKMVEQLGVTFPVPIEVIPAAMGLVTRKIEELGARPQLRMAVKKDGPIVTENGNFVVDIYFSDAPDVHRIDGILKSIPGVVETGLFLGMAQRALVAREDGVAILRPRE